MGTVYKKTFTKPLPEGAELFTRKGERFARWTDGKGKTRTEKVTTGKDGAPRLLIEAATFTAKYRDGGRIVREVTTGCHDETAARQVLADLLKRAEHVKAGLTTAAQDAVIDQQNVPLSAHVDAFLAHLTAKGTTETHRQKTRAHLERVAGECKLSRLADIERPGVEGWLARRAGEGASAAARNACRSVWVAFCNWAVSTRRLVANPLAGIHKADEKADPRRHRRALTEAELVKLLDVARRRPLAEVGRESQRKADAPQDAGKRRNTWTKLPLTLANMDAAEERARKILADKPGLIARLERLGLERCLIYKTLTLTGLRKAELGSLTVGQLDLDTPRPSALLHAADEKNRQGSRIMLRPELATDLRAWLADRLTAAQDAARRRDEAIPAFLPSDTPLFRVPSQLVKILDRDLETAGIGKRDGRGWTVDVHALRHTFGTLLSKAGVAPRTAQAAMRHSSIDLTMNTYTDPRLLDVAGALNALPSLPLTARPGVERQKATGTFDASPLAPVLAPTLAPNGDDRGKTWSTAGRAAGAVEKVRASENSENRLEKQGFGQSQANTNKGGQTGRYRTRTCDFILVSEQGQGSKPFPDNEVTTGDSAACTCACTGEPQNVNGTAPDAQGEGTATGQGDGLALSNAEGLAGLARAIANLSADDRARLAAMLAQGGGNGEGNGR